ncbi:hypothetical protein [Rhodoferax lithotrophicus]|uniref:hypothetical protein n=1 Tax=Rhodoferax lithotrophicus TaxID=2798804 RepID=UPI001CC6B943|nr:hypothetical protein [Rhodoferax sp. MIZ03]
MSKFTITIHAQPQAPGKPAVGAPCNGCGVCCLMEPCPLGIVLSGRRIGACDALCWRDEDHLYRCGAITQPLQVVYGCLPQRLRWAAPLFAWVLQRLAHRWVAAGVGCDCDAQVADL